MSVRGVPLVLFVALVACGPSGASTSLAVGARGELFETLGPCASVASATLRFEEGRYEALAPGTERVACRDGTYTIHVAPIARLEIEPVPSARVGQPLVFAVRASDAAGNELTIGRDTTVAWSFGGALASRPTPGCGDIVPICPSRAAGYAVAASAGSGTITAALGSARAVATTSVGP